VDSAISAAVENYNNAIPKHYPNCLLKKLPEYFGVSSVILSVEKDTPMTTVGDRGTVNSFFAFIP
jgi:hypothetical protein